MKTDKPENPPAFPCAHDEIKQYKLNPIPAAYYPGMELRDYFAAKVISHFLNSNESVKNKIENSVEMAYKTADAMILERSKHND